MTGNFKLFVSEALGSVSAEIFGDKSPRAVLTLAHGAGAGMNHPFMLTLAKELATHKIATLRFNFPYMEQKKRRPDLPAVAHQAIEAALHKAQELFPGLPVYASGKSFGGRMSSQYVAKAQPDFVKGIVFFGFPLHPAGKPATDRAQHLSSIKIPMLFLQGTRDELAQWDLIEGVVQTLPSAVLRKIEGADHSFKKGKENFIPYLAGAVAEWLELKK